MGTALVFLYSAIPIAVLLWAVAPGHDDSFYMFLRVVVCAGAVPIALLFFGQKRKYWLLVFVAIGLLYNPFFLVQLAGDIWLVLNIATALAFAVGFVALWLEARRASRV